MARKASANSKPREHRNREQEVLAAAIDVFSKKGYAAASIQDVADQVGVLKGSLYHYIDSKEDLLFQIFDQSHAQAAEIIAEVNDLDLPPLEKLHTYLLRYVRWYLENVERVSIYFSEFRHLTGKRLATVKKQRSMYETVIADLIEEARDAGELDSALDVKLASFYVLGAVNGVPTWYKRSGRGTPSSIAAAYADMTIGMLKGTRATAAA